MKRFKRFFQWLRIVLTLNKVKRATADDERLVARKALANLFADARGMAMKFGQLLIESDEDDPMQILHTSIQPLPLKKIKPIIEAELGQPIKRVFRRIEESKAAASLGQVHFAELVNGEKVAIKVRYPDIADAIDSELELAGLLPGIGPVKRWGFDLEAYKQVLAENMHRELDYLSEADRQQRFYYSIQVNGLQVPKVYPELCRDGLLVQSRVSGQLIDSTDDWSENDRERLAKTLLTTFFKSLFVAGLVHGDPHPGNAFYKHNQHGEPVLSLLDYGCMIELDKIQRLALLKLIIGSNEHNDCNPFDAFVTLGFNAKKLAYIHASLPALCQILFQPFLESSRFNLSQWQVKQEMFALLGEDRWWFRSAGSAELFLLLRAFQGLVQQLKRLKVNLSWWLILNQSIDHQLIQQARDFVLPNVSATLNLKAISFTALAKNLHVKVSEFGRQKVAVTLPAKAVLELVQLMPEDVRQRIQQSDDIDLDQILERIRKSGIQAQTVFEVEQDGKLYEVWLD